MIVQALPERTAGVAAGTAERLAAAARLADSDADAVAAVRRLLDEVLA